MTRIISGFAGSIPLAVPRSGTRPTSDRIREALFSALDARDLIHGATVLDLYAGSGALGLEAASRGAATVTLVERSPAAAAVLRRNSETVRRASPARHTPSVQVITRPVQSFLEDAASVTADLVFLDPPYQVTEAELAEALTDLVKHLASGAIIIVERATRSPEPTWPSEIQPDRRSAYGDTALWWASHRSRLSAKIKPSDQ